MSLLIQYHQELKNLALVLAGMIGIPLAVWRSWVAHKQTRITALNNKSEVFRLAAENLGTVGGDSEPNYAGRVAAMVILTDNAIDNPEFADKTIKVLSAYLLENATSEKNARRQDVIRCIRAIINVLDNKQVAVHLKEFVYYIEECHIFSAEVTENAATSLQFKRNHFIDCNFHSSQVRVYDSTFDRCNFFDGSEIKSQACFSSGKTSNKTEELAGQLESSLT